ncbi:glycoside hydrolase family 43 protein [Rhabdothermincola salaria]|uniref:glycoside hydrolase family 43 protein n=1 Tax=Rhabdothermincola salaria TaxID=2903142 RepID=UPI001E59AF33|nr:glycoside hydrolase family 43 protein [Rhabdothermincola salaria]MCD9623583.1 glycoside hydrolase family 43 protein [Rhabdothermincola salaria]
MDPMASSAFDPQYVGAPWFEPGQLYDQNFPDPTVVRHGDRYWAYSTSTGGPTLPAMWSDDLENWYARDAHDPNEWNGDPYFNDAVVVPPSWSLGGAQHFSGKAQWGPGVARFGDSWVAYTSWETSTPGRRCISAAPGPSPEGPFRDTASRPLVCDDDHAGSIDPEVFRDESGRAHLVWKSEGGNSPTGWRQTRIWSQRLNSTGTGFATSRPALLLETALPWEGPIIENPSMVHHGGTYWLLYSGNDWASSNYAMGVARCDGPSGPCVRTRDTPLVPNDDERNGAGGGSLFVDADGQLRMAYHAWNPPYSAYPSNSNCDGNGECTSQGQRFLHVDKVLAWNNTLTVSPIGLLDRVETGPRSVSLSGWALDPATANPLDIHVYVDGVGHVLTADRPRSEVGNDFPGYGSAHGFSASVPASGGSHQVCAYAINVGSGGNSLLGCRTVVVPSGSPVGSLDVVSGGPGSVRVAGWAVDPDTAASIDVHVYVDGRGYPLRADRSRSDVGAAFPGYGSAHGFSVSVPASGGSHQVCAYAINVGSGGNSLLGCRTVVVPSGSPFGSLDVVSAGPGSVRVAGWALDPDTAASIPVHVYVGGRGTALTADRTRSDVGAAYPGYGSAHGFSRTLSASPGAQRVCAYAINVGRGSTTLLGCRTVVVPSGSPFGSLDVVTRSGSEVRVAGWALDPDTAAPIDVHVYVGGSGFALTADRSRPDVGAAFPGYGSAHGFSRTLAIDGRGLPVCVYAINTGRGANSLIGCR